MQNNDFGHHERSMEINKSYNFQVAVNSHKSIHLVSFAAMTVVPLPQAKNEHDNTGWTKNISSPLTEHAIRN